MYFDSYKRDQSAKSCRYTYIDQSIKIPLITQMSAGQRSSLFQLFNGVAFISTFTVGSLYYFLATSIVYSIYLYPNVIFPLVRLGRLVSNAQLICTLFSNACQSTPTFCFVAFVLFLSISLLSLIKALPLIIPYLSYHVVLHLVTLVFILPQTSDPANTQSTFFTF